MTSPRPSGRYIHNTGVGTASLLLLLALFGQLPAAQALELSAVVRVRVAPADHTPVASQGTATGLVSAYRKATIAAEVGGRIVERIAEPGTLARTGDVLMRIDPERLQHALNEARARAQARQVEVDHALHELKRSEGLYQRNVISKDTLDDLRFTQRRAQADLRGALVAVANAERNLADSAVKAPFSGQVEQVNVQLGDHVAPGQPILVMTDFSVARLTAGVSSSEVGNLRVGDAAQAGFADLGGVQRSVKVTSVGRIKDSVSGTYPVEMRLDDPIVAQLREGMVATVIWEARSSSTRHLSIPSSALIRRDGRIAAYVVTDGISHLRSLEIGTSNGQRVEVLRGLNPGDLVVVEGQFALRDGARVEIDNPPRPEP